MESGGNESTEARGVKVARRRHGKKNENANATSAVAEAACVPLGGSDADAGRFEDAHVHAVYADIAGHFSATRHTAWPLVQEFVDGLGAHAVVLDVGCGNGKYLRRCASSLQQYAVGVDTCVKLVDVARRDTGADCATANGLALPFKDGTFDAVLCIAVVHHLSTRARRIAALGECLRVVAVGGLALVYVWAQERYSGTGDVSKNERYENGDASIVANEDTCNYNTADGQKVRSKMMRRKFEHQDMLVPWHLRSKKHDADSDRILGQWHEVHKRYYHIYTKGELEEELRLTSFNFTTVKTYYDHQNWCAIVRRTA